MKKIKEQKVIYANSVGSINEQISKYIAEGWQPIGSHMAVVSHEQLRYSGMQHKDTIVEVEYSQSIVRYDNEETISVGVYYYFQDDAETIKVYDEEEMRNEFEEKLLSLTNPLK